jgi:hypothetical protein
MADDKKANGVLTNSSTPPMIAVNLKVEMNKPAALPAGYFRNITPRC